jgi:hypothetical protein
LRDVGACWREAAFAGCLFCVGWKASERGALVAEVFELALEVFGGLGGPEGFGDLGGEALAGGDEGEESGVGFGEAHGGEGGDEGVAEGGLVGGEDGGAEVGDGGGGAVLGENEGGLGGEVVGVREEGGGPGEGGFAVEAEDAADAGAEELRFIGTELGAEAEEEGSRVGADLLDGAGGVDADGEVFIGEERCEMAEEDGRREIAALDEGECAGAAERAGGVGAAAPSGFELMVVEAGEEDVEGLVLEGGEGAGELVFGPALGVGLDGVGGGMKRRKAAARSSVRTVRWRRAAYLAARETMRLLRCVRALRRCGRASAAGSSATAASASSSASRPLGGGMR